MPAQSLPIDEELQKALGGALNSAMGQMVDNNDIKYWWNNIEPRSMDGMSGHHENIVAGLFVRSCKTGDHIRHISANRYLKDSLDELLEAFKSAGLRQTYTMADIESDSDEDYDTHSVNSPWFLRARDKKAYLFTDMNSSLYMSVSNRRNGTWVVVNFVSTDDAMVRKIAGTLQLSLESRDDEIELDIVSENSRGQLDLVSLGKPAEKLVEGNYNSKALEQFKYATEQLTSDNPDGRLVILHGPPGSGKTFMLKAFMSECDPRKTKVIFFPPEIFANVNTPSITKLMIDNSTNKKTILFIEDGDSCVLKRGSDNMSVIASLLSFADGFVGSLLDIRIIITTNAKQLDMDDALLRDGRLCEHIKVNKLESDHASMIFKRLTGHDRTFNSGTSLASVYKLAAQHGKMETKP